MVQVGFDDCASLEGILKKKYGVTTITIVGGTLNTLGGIPVS